MISDIVDHEHAASLRADVVIVGSGLGGVEAARQLAAAGRSVLILESGRKDFDPKIQALYATTFAGKPHREYKPGAGFHENLPEEYRGENRLRQLGGTSNSWTGKWRPYTQSELESKPWIPASHWPIDVQDLLPHYRAITQDYGLGDVFDELESPRTVQIRSGIAPAGLDLKIHYWQQETTRVQERFGDELAKSERIHVICGASVTGLTLDATHERVVSAQCASLEGRAISAEGEAFILATGGLEVPRLLLASNKQKPAGIGNDHDNVGRYYTDHLKCQSIKFLPGPAIHKWATDMQTKPRPRFGICLHLNDAILEAHKLLRHSFYFTPIYARRLNKLRRMLMLGGALRDECGLIDHYKVKFAGEQTPHRDSRVRLGEKCDALGMPELVIDWQFTELDHYSVRESCQVMKQQLASAGLGELVLPADPMTIDDMTDAAHPTGTTRMADSAEHGVVDRDCRVFGTDNLHIASSSVFPTGSVYSPTFTILAIAHRLGSHLGSHLKPSTPAAS